MYLKSENFGDLLAALGRGIYEPVSLLSLDNREILHRADRIFRTSGERETHSPARSAECIVSTIRAFAYRIRGGEHIYSGEPEVCLLVIVPRVIQLTHLFGTAPLWRLLRGACDVVFATLVLLLPFTRHRL